MAAAAATETSYGYKVTGGTSATTVTSDNIWIYKLEYIPATNANKVTITDKASASITKIAGAVANDSNERLYGERQYGTKFNGFIITLTGASDELHIYKV